MVIEHWFRQTHCVSYFTKMNLDFFMISPVKKSYIICLLICWVNLRYICPLNSGLIKNIVSVISLRYIHVISWFDQWIIQTLFLTNLMSSFGVTLVIEQLFKQTLCVRYFTKWINHSEWSRQLGYFINLRVSEADTMCYVSYWAYIYHTWQP